VGRAGPKKVHRYSLEFKRTAVQLSQLRSVQVQTVAAAERQGVRRLFWIPCAHWF